MNDTDRRAVLRGLAGGAGLWCAQGLWPAWARNGSPGLRTDPEAVEDAVIRLVVGRSRLAVDGRVGNVVTLNGQLPGPLIRLREGRTARLSVTNTLDEDTSIHWHGLLVPFDMDGVPGVSFPGIPPGETFQYVFPIRQSGTYWYHSHSNMQEAMGCYGPMVIDPAGADPVAFDREHILVLSDWSNLHPHAILDVLKKSPGAFNQSRTTLSGLVTGEDGLPLADRRMWGAMRMDPRDIADVTAATYSYLVNGHGPDQNWTGLFTPGERVRLRIINASAMTTFNLRIPGLAMTVVSADGADVRPVETDEIQIAVAETYDVIVRPHADRAFTVVAECVDRSGMARATLAPRAGMSAETPPLRPPPTLSMEHMGMGATESGHGGHGAPSPAGPETRTGSDRDPHHADPGLTHASVSAQHAAHGPGEKSAAIRSGVGVDMVSSAPVDRLGQRPLGLEDVSHRVLVYADLASLAPNPDQRPPSRAIEIHLTGNMERYMWSFDGRKFSDVVEPIRFEEGERVRVTLVNDTMMGHPIHLHGHFFGLVTGGPEGHQPLKHTVNVAPGSKLSFDLTADAPGDWAFHCHLLMHMHAGMFNVVTVRPRDGDGR